MKKKHASELYASLATTNVELNNSGFDVLSLRISHRSNAIVQAFTAAFQRPALTLFTDELSQLLARSLLNSVENEPIIVEEAETGIQPGSALDLLVANGAIKYDDDVLRGIRNIFQESAK